MAGEYVLAAGVGLVALRKYQERINNRIDDARDDSRDAYQLAARHTLQIDALRDAFKHGDLVRLASDRVSDFHVGLCYGQPVSITPSPTATVPVPQPRPYISEAQILAHGVWPEVVNGYDDKGNLTSPGTAFSASSLAQSGLMIGMGEVSSFLAGLVQTSEPTPAQQVQLFRMARAMGAVPIGRNFSANEWRTIFEALFSLPVVPGQRGGLLYCQQARGANIGPTGAEEFAAPIVLPAGSLPIGRALRMKFGWYLPTANGTNTVRFGLRWGSSGGPLLFQTTAVDPGNAGDSATIDFVLARQADSPTGYPVLVGSGQSVVKSAAVGVSESLSYGQSAPGAPGGPGSADQAIVLVPSVLFSAADAANLAGLQFTTIELE